MSLLLFILSDLVVLGHVPSWCSANNDLVNGTDDTADEIMERIVRSATQGPSQRTQPRERRRSRVNRKSCEPCQLLANSVILHIQQRLLIKACHSLSTFSFFSVLYSEKDTEKWFDHRRGKRSWLVQWFGDAGVSEILRGLEALSLPPDGPCPSWRLISL